MFLLFYYLILFYKAKTDWYIVVISLQILQKIQNDNKWNVFFLLKLVFFLFWSHHRFNWNVVTSETCRIFSKNLDQNHKNSVRLILFLLCVIRFYFLLFFFYRNIGKFSQRHNDNGNISIQHFKKFKCGMKKKKLSRNIKDLNGVWLTQTNLSIE